MNEFSKQIRRKLSAEPTGEPTRIHSLRDHACPGTEVNLTVFVDLVSKLSARMVKVSHERLDEEIMDSLRDVCLLLGVDRAGILKVWENSPIVRLSHAWYGSGVPEVSGEVNLADLFPWCYRQLVLEGETKIIERLEDFPPEAKTDRDSHLLQGVKSSLAIPLFIGSSVHNIMVIESVKEHRPWPDEIVARLRLLGDIYVSALQRREDEQERRLAKERLDLAAASANACFWEVDFVTGILWASEKVQDLFGFDAEAKLTLPLFLEVVSAEDRQMILDAIELARSDGIEVNVEYRVPASDGQVRWMHSRGRFVAAGRDMPPRLMGVTQEVTRRKQMEQQMQEHLREINRLREQLEQENTFLRNTLATCGEQRSLLGDSACMRSVMEQVEQVARTDSTVLIQGETGTGKELVAQTIHRLSERGKREMVKVNCAALPAALVESELFGREKGAFTGALSRQIGRFEMADGATLFLDEIAEMPLETQGKLLRVLQEGEFERLGNPQTLKVNVRVIAATNRNLGQEVEQGNFRRDLYYRLNVFPIQVPPLRERSEDIPRLIWGFVNEFGERMGKKIRRIAASDMRALTARAWPGNIRELRNVIEHAMIVCRGETLDFQYALTSGQQDVAAVTLEEVERRHIQSILEATHGRVKGADGAAKKLGLNPSTLYSRMRKLGINPTHS